MARTYSLAYKRQAIGLADELGCRAAARVLGVDRKSIRRWRLELETQLLDDQAFLDRDDLTEADLPRVRAIRERTAWSLDGVQPVLAEPRPLVELSDLLA
jgi:hypothetical protein